MSQSIPQLPPRMPNYVIPTVIQEEDPQGQSLVFLRQNAKSMMFSSRPQPKVFDIDPPTHNNTSRFSSSSSCSTSSSEHSGPMTPTTNAHHVPPYNDRSDMIPEPLKLRESFSKPSNNSPSLKAAKILGISQITKLRNTTPRIRQLPSHPDIPPNFTTAGVDQIVRLASPPTRTKSETTSVSSHKGKLVGYIKKKADKASNSFHPTNPTSPFHSSSSNKPVDSNDSTIVTLDKLRRFHGEALLEGSVFVYRVNPTNLVNLQTWKKRHLALGGTQLFKFDLPSNQAANWGSIPSLEWIDLMDDVHIMVSSQFPGHNHVLKLTFPDNILWFVSFESHPTLIKWLKAFKKVKTSSAASSGHSSKDNSFNHGVKLSLSHSVDSTSSGESHNYDRITARPKFKPSTPPTLPMPTLPTQPASLSISPSEELNLRFSNDEVLSNGDTSLIIPPPTCLPPQASLDDEGNLLITYHYPNPMKQSIESNAVTSSAKRGTVIQMLNRVNISSPKQIGGAEIKLVESYQSDESQIILED